MSTVIEPARSGLTLEQIITAEEVRLMARQPRSAELTARARRSIPGGASSNWAVTRPAVIWVDRGDGSHVWDADGNEYVDLHGGYGVMAVGHNHPAVVEAVQRRIARGSHFAQPTEDAIVVAEDLAHRFGLPKWRFSNSGTEATMDAVHLMRAITGRDRIIKIEGSYHGHHDAVMVNTFNSAAQIGPAERPVSVAGNGGIPQAMVDLVIAVPFNDLSAVERAFAEHPGTVAGMILEPMMMNASMIPPLPGYLEGLREITRRHDALLAFDEVKTGLTIAPGGAIQRFGVRPDIVCLAKALGGGLPCGAVGGTDEVMSAITSGVYDQVGTFNANPLTMAAARATLTEVLTNDVYARVEQLGRTMLDESLRVVQDAGIAVYGLTMGIKGCLVFNGTPVRDYREFLHVDSALSHAHWLFQHNGGVFLPPWGKSEQWTLSVQHTADDTARYVANVGRFVEAVAPAVDLHADRYTGTY
jgi:glutamate-1-semialdehyde 2,1-aminomutase